MTDGTTGNNIEVASVHESKDENTFAPILSFLMDAIALGKENTIRGMVIRVPILKRYVVAMEKAFAAIS